MKLPRELLEVVDEVVKPTTEPSLGQRPELAARLSVALECWLHGSVTTEEAIVVLRTPPSRRGSPVR